MIRVTPPRGHSGRASAAFILGVLAFLLMSLLAAPVRADLRPMEVVWQESFELDPTIPVNPRQPYQPVKGWDLVTYTRDDVIGIAPAPSPLGPACPVTDSYLKGTSPSDVRGAGFRAATPTFEQIGIDPREPYAVRFDYRLETACWSYVLCSRHVSLMVLECHPESGTATLVAVDELTQTCVPLGDLTLGVWHQIDVLVEPRPTQHASTVTIRFDGTFRARLEHWPALENRDRLVFMDLPFRPWSGDTSATMGLCFTDSAWDQLEVWREEPETPPRDRDFELGLSPNPFNPSTRLSFVLDEAADVRVDVFDLAGRLVRPLLAATLPAGPQAIDWNGTDERGTLAASGIYLLRVDIEGRSLVRRAVLVR